MRRFTLLVFLFGIWIVASSYLAWYVTTFPTIERCQEDVVLLGAGEYENGIWERYECGPAVDDYALPS